MNRRSFAIFMAEFLSGCQSIYQIAKDNVVGIGILSLVVVALLFSIHLASDHIISTSDAMGTLEGFHQVQTRHGSSYAVYAVRLSTGEVVTVSPPLGTQFANGAMVKIIRAKTEQGREFFYFKSYEKPSNLSFHTDPTPGR